MFVGVRAEFGPTRGSIGGARRAPRTHRSALLANGVASRLALEDDRGYHFSMASTISVDRAGRVVVPKPLRQRLGLVGGGKVRVWEEGGRLVMEPVPDETVLVEDGGLLLCGGRLEGDMVSIDDLRGERIDELVRDAIG